MNKRKFNWKLLIAIIMIILLNIFLLSLIKGVKKKNYTYIIISVDVVLTLLFLISIRGFFKKETKKVKPIKKSIDLNILEDAKIIIPNNEEIIETTVSNIYTYEEEIESDPKTIVRPGEFIEQDAYFVNDIDMEQYTILLTQFLEESGLKVEISTNREIISALASSRVIVVNNKENEISKYFIELLGKFIGAHSFFSMQNKEWKTFNSFLSNKTIQKAIQSAAQEKDFIHFIALSNFDLNITSEYVSEISSYGMNPYAKIVNSEEKSFPENMWFFLINNQSDEFANNLVNQNAVHIDLRATLVEPKNQVYVNSDKISYKIFKNMMIDETMNHLIDEAVWKEFDQIIDYLKNNDISEIDNKVIRQIERYTSFYSLTGGTITQAVDSILTNKIMKMINFEKLSNKEEIGNFSITIEKIFGTEKIEVTYKKIKELEQQYKK